MHCAYFDADECRSCTLLPVPYVRQVLDKQAHLVELLPEPTWLEPVRGPESEFRNKAKMVVAGTLEAPTLGILDAEHHGVDLRSCGLHEPAVAAALPVLAEAITAARVPPYDVAARRGELKHLLVTGSPTGELMVRFVLRSTEAVPRIRKQLPTLRERLPGLTVLSVNLQPEPKAVLEGPEEIVLTEEQALPMPVGPVRLLLRPQSFFQTNTAVAGQLYAQVAAWVDELAPRTLWDLYCGVGGFALACAAPGRTVIGVESSAGAVASATSAALDRAIFVVGDATEYARTATQVPDVVIVNPPRRGIGPELADWLEISGVGAVVYSSCNPESLARDLAAMPSLRPRQGRLFDMFPQTRHQEVAVLLIRDRG